MSLAGFTLPPPTRAVGTINPPGDMNQVVLALLAQQAPNNLASAAFGGVNDGRVTQDCVTNATTTITSATITFTAADAGKLAIITGAADGDAEAGNFFAAAIASVTNSTTAVLASAPGFTESACNLVVGTDNASAINAWLAAVAGGRGYAPAGIWCSSGTHTVPGSTLIYGDGYDLGAATTNYPPRSGTVFVFGGSGNPSYFFRLGSTQTYEPGSSNARVRDIAFDGSNLCQSTVLLYGNRCKIQDCQVWRGSYHAVQVDGQGCWIQDNTFGQQNCGDVLYVSGSDCHVTGNVFRQPGGSGAVIRITGGPSDVEIIGNHLFSFYSAEVSSTYPCNNIIIANTVAGATMDNFIIANNLLDGVYGHSIVLTASGGSNCEINNTTITGNSFFNCSGFPDATFDVIRLDPQSGGYITGLSVEGNTVRSVEETTDSWEYLVGMSGGAGSFTVGSVQSNTGRGVRKMWWPGVRPGGGRIGNVLLPTAQDSGATPVKSSDDGTATFSGTGSQTTFSITHNLAATPVTVLLTPASAAAAAYPFYWTASSSTITVTFTTAPGSGTNNVVLSWFATL